MSGAKLYAAMVVYVELNGWQRTEPGDGWWWHPDRHGEETLGAAVESQFLRDGIDTRYGPFAAAPGDNG